MTEIPLDILLVDDEPLIRLTVGDALRAAGHQLTLASDGAAAWSILDRRSFDLVISDIRLPKMDGLTLFKRLRAQTTDTDVILITAYGTVSDAVTALKDGARDYLTKPFDTEELLLRIRRLGSERALRWQLREARKALASSSSSIRGMIGSSPAMLRMLDRIEAYADSDASVLIQGESGTGKELVAHRLHDHSTRHGKPFVAVNCAAFPETLLDAELFGHERGAFTGATKRRVGRFQAADGGTLFLDEVAEIPSAAQAKLLRVLQERTVEPLGSNRSIPVDVRILSATHRNLRERIAEGTFREDLFYRLNVLELSVPPLRERHGDLPLLIEFVLRKLSREDDPPTISPRAIQALSTYDFPGNVRELEHAIHQAFVLSRGQSIRVEHLPSDVAGHLAPRQTLNNFSDDLKLGEAVRMFERDHLIRALRKVSGRRSKAAGLLGISRKTLWEKMKSYGIDDAEIAL